MKGFLRLGHQVQQTPKLNSSDHNLIFTVEYTWLYVLAQFKRSHLASSVQELSMKFGDSSTLGS